MPGGRRPHTGVASKLLDYYESNPGAELTLEDMMRMFGVRSRRSMSTQIWLANQLADGIRIEQTVVYSLRVG